MKPAFNPDLTKDAESGRAKGVKYEMMREMQFSMQDLTAGMQSGGADEDGMG